MKVIEIENGYRIVIEDADEIHVRVKRNGATAECHWAGEMTERQYRQLRVALLHREFSVVLACGLLRL